MWKKFADFCQIVIKMLLVLAIAIGTWFFLTPYFRLEKNEDGDRFRNLPENSIDVIALGSSHMQYAFNPAIMYAETGYYSYVLGSSCQPLRMSTGLLREALKTQHPSLVIVDVFTLLEQSETCYADGMFYKAIDEMTGLNRLETANNAPENVRLQYKYDLLMNHDQWKNIDLSNLDSFVDNATPTSDIDYDLGYVFMEPENPRYAPLITYEVTKKKELDSKSKEAIDELIDLCKEEGIKLVFVKTPYIIDQESTNTLASIWNYLDKKNVSYIDYIQKAEQLDWFIDMDGDTWHNNSWGAEIITKDLASYVKDNNLVKNHRKNKTYENIITETLKYTSYALMNNKNVNIYRLLDEASKYPSIVIMNYKGKSHTSLGEYENNALQALGMTKDFLNDTKTDYYAVIQNGKLIKESNEPFDVEVKDIHISIDTDKVMINDTEYERSGEMQIIFLDSARSWTNEVNIDYATKWFWKNGCDGFECEG